MHKYGWKWAVLFGGLGAVFGFGVHEQKGALLVGSVVMAVSFVIILFYHHLSEDCDC